MTNNIMLRGTYIIYVIFLYKTNINLRNHEKRKLKSKHLYVAQSGRVQTHDECHCHSGNTCFAYVDTETQPMFVYQPTR